MTVVAEEDASHAIWPSCPARGWSAGVEKLTARPVPGAELVPHLLKERTLETHGPCTFFIASFLQSNLNAATHLFCVRALEDVWLTICASHWMVGRGCLPGT